MIEETTVRGAADPALSFTHRGTRFTATPLPARESLALGRLAADLQKLGDRMDTAAVEERSAILDAVASTFPACCRPTRLWDRLVWRGRNPFADATEYEIGWLLGFFLGTRSIVRIRPGPAASALLETARARVEARP